MRDRRPDPEPMKTDDRTAVLVGLVLWIVALVALLLVPTLADSNGWALWSCVAGIALGVLGLIYTSIRRH